MSDDQIKSINSIKHKLFNNVFLTKAEQQLIKDLGGVQLNDDEMAFRFGNDFTALQALDFSMYECTRFLNSLYIKIRE